MGLVVPLQGLRNDHGRRRAAGRGPLAPAQHRACEPAPLGALPIQTPDRHHRLRAQQARQQRQRRRPQRVVLDDVKPPPQAVEGRQHAVGDGLQVLGAERRQSANPYAAVRRDTGREIGAAVCGHLVTAPGEPRAQLFVVGLDTAVGADHPAAAYEGNLEPPARGRGAHLPRVGGRSRSATGGLAGHRPTIQTSTRGRCTAGLFRPPRCPKARRGSSGRGCADRAPATTGRCSACRAPSSGRTPPSSGH